MPYHLDRKSTRLNSSHGSISYAVFCLKKKKNNTRPAYRLLVSLPSAADGRHSRTRSEISDTVAVPDLGAGFRSVVSLFFFFFNDTATTEIYTLSLHDALPISRLNSSHGSISYAVFWSSDV